MMPTAEHIEALLMNNWHWTNGCPYVKGVSFEEAKKAYSVEKRTALYGLFKPMLDKCEKVNGNTFAMDVWLQMQRPLLTAHWEKGPHRIWRGIYKRASLKVQQDKPKQIGQEVDKLFVKSQSEAFS